MLSVIPGQPYGNYDTQTTSETFQQLPDIAAMPPAVLTAIAVIERVEALPIPAEPHPTAEQAARAAAEQVAAQLVADAATSKAPRLDVAAIAAARADEQSVADARWAMHRARAHAHSHLVRTVRDHSDEVLAALRDEHAKSVEAILAAHRALPDKCDDQVALDAGGKVRTAWLSLRDNVARAEQIQQAVDQVAGRPRRDTDEEHLRRWVRDLNIIGRAFGRPGEVQIGKTQYPAGSVEQYRAMAEKVSDPTGWWCPTPSERVEVDLNLRAAHDEERARLAMANARPSGAGW